MKLGWVRCFKIKVIFHLVQLLFSAVVATNWLVTNHGKFSSFHRSSVKDQGQCFFFFFGSLFVPFLCIVS